MASECLRRWGQTLFCSPAFSPASLTICQALFRLMGKILGLCAYQGQTVDAHLRHIGCVFFSYVLMEQMKAYAIPTPEKANTLTTCLPQAGRASQRVAQ